MYKFSKYLKTKKKVVALLIEKLSAIYPYVSVLGTDVVGLSISVDNRSTSVAPAGVNECGFVIKVYDGTIYSEYSTNEMEEKNLDNIVEDIKALTSSKTKSKRVKVPVIVEEELKQSFARRPRGRKYETNEIIDILKKNVSEAKTKENIFFVGAMMTNVGISKMFMSTKRDLEQFYTWSETGCVAMAKANGETKDAYNFFGSNSVESNIQKVHGLLLDTAKLANELLSATLPIPGVYDVITDPDITGLIAHEAFGHGVEMDMFVKNRAQAKDYIDKQVASPLITMHDGALATTSVASYFFDDDGVLASDTTIIENGILKRGISDCLSALELKTKPTGNGRRESYKRKSYTRMTNTFFEKGTSRLSDMIKSIKHGYLLCRTSNGMEDPKNWGIQCTAHYGREIVDGKFSGKIVSPVVMSGYVLDLLNSITAVSKDFDVIGAGGCGKGHKEWVRVSCGGPYMKARVKIG